MPSITTRIVDVRGAPMLAPAWQADADVLRAINEPMQTTVLRYTGTDALRSWYWALVTVSADGLGIHKNDLHAQLKLKAGLVEAYLLGPTGPVATLKSIRRDAINRSDLKAYVDIAVEILFSSYLPGVKRRDVLDRVEQLVGPRPK